MTGPDGRSKARPEEQDITCREVVELVTDYLEDALAPDLRARLEAHLAACEGCETYVDQIRTTIRIVGSVSEEALPPETREGLLRAFRDWKTDVR
jgi:predicted anti-sigma-YlaC factor YlaD